MVNPKSEPLFVGGAAEDLELIRTTQAIQHGAQTRSLILLPRCEVAVTAAIIFKYDRFRACEVTEASDI